MVDYKEMYYKMVRASEQAINILIAAQRECEKLYLASKDPDLKLIELQNNDKPQGKGGFPFP